jgi:hypothetical protein
MMQVLDIEKSALPIIWEALIGFRGDGRRSG